MSTSAKANKTARSHDTEAPGHDSPGSRGSRGASLQAPPSGIDFVDRARAAPGQGLPSALRKGIESLSGLSMGHVRVHYNSPRPAQVGAQAFAQGSQIHLSPGQEHTLPHEAWHVVQQAQGRVKPTMQMTTGVPVNDDVGLETEADVMGGKALRRVENGEKEQLNFVATANQPIAQLTKHKKTKAKAKVKTATAKAKKAKAKAKKDKTTDFTGGEDRYTGHDSTGNKKALIHVLNHRKQTLAKSLSHPEETAHGNSAENGAPQTGRANITSTMILGTAICHKISDKSIRGKINSLFKAEKLSKDNTELDSYLISLANYIKPAHATDETPTGGDYAKEAQSKYENAFSARLDMVMQTSGSATRLKNAHIVGKNVANSPVNLFLGDSVTNSSIQAHFDQNTYDAPVGEAPPPTPRSARARPVNDLVNTGFGALVLPSTHTKKSSRPGET